MPIIAFNSFTDGLDPHRRSREHFIANTNLDDDRLWVPYANGVWFQPCCFNVTSGGFSVLLKGLPGSMVGTHYHVGTVHGPEWGADHVWQETRETGQYHSPATSKRRVSISLRD